MTRRVDVDAIAKRPAWMQQAACADSPELPWIEEHKQTRGYPRRVMAGICAQCPVLTGCDQYASTSTVQAGFWAGRARTAQDNGRGRWPDKLITPTPATTPEQSSAVARRRLGPPVSQPRPVPVVTPATTADSVAPGPRRPPEPTTGSSRPGPATDSPTPITRLLRRGSRQRGSFQHRSRVGGDRMDLYQAARRLTEEPTQAKTGAHG